MLFRDDDSFKLLELCGVAWAIAILYCSMNYCSKVLSVPTLGTRQQFASNLIYVAVWNAASSIYERLSCRISPLERLAASNACADMLQGAIIIGLLFVTFIAWIPNHAASYLGSQSDIAGELVCMNIYE